MENLHEFKDVLPQLKRVGYEVSRVKLNHYCVRPIKLKPEKWKKIVLCEMFHTCICK